MHVWFLGFMACHDSFNVEYIICKGFTWFSSFNISEAAELMKDICIAIKYIHDMGMAHRDLKPENLLYSNKGEDLYF